MSGGGSDVKVKPSNEEKQLAQIAQERWERYENKFVPAENEYISEIEEINTGHMADKAEGEVTAAAHQSFDDSVEKTLAKTAAAGADPSSGRWQAQSSGLADARGSSLAKGLQNVHEGLENQELSGLKNVIAMGQGQSSEALSGLGGLAENAAREAQADAQAAAALDSAQANLAGNVLGAGARYAAGGLSGGGGGQPANAPIGSDYGGTAGVLNQGTGLSFNRFDEL